MRVDAAGLASASVAPLAGAAIWAGCAVFTDAVQAAEGAADVRSGIGANAGLTRARRGRRLQGIRSAAIRSGWGRTGHACARITSAGAVRAAEGAIDRVLAVAAYPAGTGARRVVHGELRRPRTVACRRRVAADTNARIAVTHVPRTTVGAVLLVRRVAALALGASAGRVVDGEVARIRAHALRRRVAADSYARVAVASIVDAAGRAVLLLRGVATLAVFACADRGVYG